MTIIVTTTTTTGQLSDIINDLELRGYGADTRTSQISMINAAYRRVSGLRRWPWLEQQSTSTATVVGTPNYALANTVLHVDAMRAEKGTDYYELEWKPIQEFRALEHNYRDNGNPQYWTKARNSVLIWPRPDATYTLTIDYSRVPTDLSADTDVPLIPSHYRDILMWGAIKEMCFRERDWDGWNQAQAEYNGRVMEMMGEYGVTQRQNSREVGRSSYWSGSNQIGSSVAWGT